MARYTPELLASLKHAYENTDEPMRLIADRHTIGITTLQTLATRGGWAKRSRRMRDGPVAAALFEDSEPPIATLPQPSGQVIDADGASDELAASIAPPAPEAPAEGGPPLSPAARLEALIVKQIAAEEARADLYAQRRMRGSADRCARTLVILGQALEKAQKLRADEQAAEEEEYEEPRDLDEFREAVAKRIESFVARAQAEKREKRRRAAEAKKERERLAAIGQQRAAQADDQ